MQIPLPNRRVQDAQKQDGIVVLDAAELALDGLLALHPTSVQVVGIWCEERYRVDAVQETKAELRCARCLESFVLPLRSTWTTWIAPTGKAQEFVSVTPWVREAVLLELPMIFVCKTDCPGLCSSCGTHRDACACAKEAKIDARWKKLQTMREDLRSS